MIPDSLAAWAHANQELLWLCTLSLDLLMTIILFRIFGRQGLYASVVLGILLANLQGPKLTQLFGFETSLGVILYSGIYFATDLLSERYGRREANRAVMVGFGASLVIIVVMSLSVLFLPSRVPEHAEFAQNTHDAIATLFNFTPRFILGSLLAYLISQRLDVWIFHALRARTGSRHLWLRNNVSTMASQAVDTLVYSLVVWWGVVSLENAIALGLAKYVIKLFIASFDTPFIYWARDWWVEDRDWVGSSTRASER